MNMEIKAQGNGRSKGKGTLEEAMEKCWILFLGGKASYISTRRYLERLDVYNNEDIIVLIKMLLRHRKELMGF